MDSLEGRTAPALCKYHGRRDSRLIQFPNMPSPVTAWGSEPASNLEQLGGQFVYLDIQGPTPVQADGLRRLYALSWATAATVARLASGWRDEGTRCPRIRR